MIVILKVICTNSGNIKHQCEQYKNSNSNHRILSCLADSTINIISISQ